MHTPVVLKLSQLMTALVYQDFFHGAQSQKMHTDCVYVGAVSLG